MGAINKSIIESVSDIIKRSVVPIDPKDFHEFSKNSEYLVLDTRTKEDFQRDGFVPGSMWIGIRCSKGNEMRFANWVGTLVNNLKQKIIYVCSEGYEEEVVTRLARVGYDNAQGYLKGGVKGYVDAGFELAKYEVAPLTAVFAEEKNFTVLDVRNDKQWGEIHIKNAEHCTVRDLSSQMGLFDKDKEYVVYCNSGFQATICCAMLMQNGISVRLLEQHMNFFKKVKGLLE